MTAQTSHERDYDQEQGSFVMGLTIGMLAGAVKYFLDRSEHGQELRQRIVSEWQSVMSTLDEQEAAELQPGWLKGSLGEFLGKVFGVEKAGSRSKASKSETDDSERANKASKRKASTSSTSKKHTFRGV